MQQTELLEQVSTIKSVLDRSALYRRSLCPAFLICGLMGVGGAIAAHLLKIIAPKEVLLYWIFIAGLTVIFTLIQLIRQCKVEGSNFWEGPLRRMFLSSLPPLTVGAMGGVYALMYFPDSTLVSGQVVIGWLALYGITLTSISVILARGLQWFGWLFIVSALLAAFIFELDMANTALQHIVMGVGFGLMHLVLAGVEWLRVRHG